MCAPIIFILQVAEQFMQHCIPMFNTVGTVFYVCGRASCQTVLAPIQMIFRLDLTYRLKMLILYSKKCRRTKVPSSEKWGKWPLFLPAYFNALHGSSLEVRGVKTRFWPTRGEKLRFASVFWGGGAQSLTKTYMRRGEPPLRPGEPWFVTWGPDSSCGPRSDMRGPDTSCGARVRYAEP